MDKGERRLIIAQTMENMARIYSDVGQIVTIIEQRLTNNGFSSLGDAAITWEVSTAFHKSDSWLYRYFARIYFKDRLKARNKAVGYCLHLGNYYWYRNLPEFLRFPCLSVSLVGFEDDPQGVSRSDLLNLLWSAGWDLTWWKPREIRGCLQEGEFQDHPRAQVSTFFVDMLDLVDEPAIDRLVVVPMEKMFNGEEDYVVGQGIGIPVQDIRSSA